MRAAAVLAAALLLLPLRADADSSEDYVLHCRGCHGPDGAGAPGAVPSFRGHVAKFVALPGGREYLVRVPGVSQSELSDARLAALLNWLLLEFDAADVPSDFTPYTAAEIARLRRPPLIDVEGTRRAVLAGAP